ncbi:MAG TPA: hypothetical protein VFO35_13260 [Steroidobacteraceae bacterium]|nr:hypothetical protein [Steroidobacteraceae bacterium]
MSIMRDSMPSATFIAPMDPTRRRQLSVLMRRRHFLQSATLLSALSTADFATAATGFDYAALKGRARALVPATPESAADENVVYQWTPPSMAERAVALDLASTE